MDIIYIDELFALNLIIDYLLLLCSARVCGGMLRRRRYALGALFGALFACGAVLPGFGLLSMPALKLACGVIMALIAFGGEVLLIKRTLVFMAVSAAFGGAVWGVSLMAGADVSSGGYFPLSMRVLVLSFGICYAVVSLVFRRSLKKSGRQVMTVAAAFGGRSAVFHALRDTGNTLCDPITGCEVLIISPETAADLFPAGCGGALRLSDPVEAMTRLNSIDELRGRVRLIPFSAVGVSTGLLPVFRPDSLMIEGKPRADIMIAISPAVSGKTEYEAII